MCLGSRNKSAPAPVPAPTAPVVPNEPIDDEALRRNGTGDQTETTTATRTTSNQTGLMIPKG